MPIQVPIFNPTKARARLLLAGYTQRAFAQKAELDLAHLNAVLQGHKRPSPTYLRRLAENLGCDIADLVDAGGES